MNETQRWGRTWGPRWYTVRPDGAALRKIERVGGTAERPGGTWPGLARRGDVPDPAPHAKNGGIRGPGSYPARLGSVLEQMRAWVREQTRRRVAARLASPNYVGPEGETGRDRERAELAISGADVRAYREKTGLSQRDLAAAIGCARSIVAGTERGTRASLTVLRYVAGQLAAPE